MLQLSSLSFGMSCDDIPLPGSSSFLSSQLLSRHAPPPTPPVLFGNVPLFTRKVAKQYLRIKCNRNDEIMQFPQKTFTEDGKMEETKLVIDISKIEERIGDIRLILQSIDDGNLSISAYDTAWVALVKDFNQSDVPQFPSSLHWIINHQLIDGSWGDPCYFSSYDRLLSTLACVIVLKTWNIFPSGSDKGLLFIRQNLHKLRDEDPEHQPSGFELVFLTLIESAQKLDLDVIDDFSLLQHLYDKREQKHKRIPTEMLHNIPTTLLFSLEGIPNLNWEKLIKLQHPNGSFLCSTSSTAYALMQTKDKKCFKYLKEVVDKFNGGVPHSYPIDLFERLWVVDRLDRLGFSRYFKPEIKELLDYVYRFWTPNGISWSRDTIEYDIDNTSMGFRILRLNGYDVQSSVFQHFEKEGQFYCFVGQKDQGYTEMLSLYRASQLLFPGEKILEEAINFSSDILKKKLSQGLIADRWLITKDLHGEVQYYLDIPWYVSLPRLETRYFIDYYGGDDDVWIAKVLYRMHNVSNNLYLDLAKLDYNYCQNIHQQEWNDIQKWYHESKLGRFGLSRDDLLRSYFLAMSTIFEPERAIERFAWAKTAAMVKVVSFYFKSISVKEKKIFTQTFEDRGIANKTTRNGLAEAIHKSLRQISLKVLENHGKRSPYNSLKQIWYTWLLNCFKMQPDDNFIPNEAQLLVCTINVCNGHFSPEDIITQPDYSHMMNLTNKICNYLNQIQVGRKKSYTMETSKVQMQQLVQHVMKSNKGSDMEIKRTFLVIAKSYYYITHCETTTIDFHIKKVLFQSV